MSVVDLENPPKPMFSKFSPNETGATSITPPVNALSAAVQPRCISLQNFAFCAMADPLQKPTVCLGCRIVCTTSGFAQKKDTKPVGGRGISAFYGGFFLDLFFPNEDFLKEMSRLGGRCERGGVELDRQKEGLSFPEMTKGAFRRPNSQTGWLVIALCPSGSTIAGYPGSLESHKPLSGTTQLLRKFEQSATVC